MKLKFVTDLAKKMPKPMVRFAGRAALTLKKWMPEILTGIGIGSGLAATVTACHATTKLEPILDEHKEIVDNVHKTEFQNEKDQKKALTKAYATTGKKLVKLYALPAALEALSIACQIGSTTTLRKENKALAAAYMGLLEAYKAQHGGSTEELEKNGEKDGKTTFVETNRLSPYAVIFDKSNSNWRRRASDNEVFLRSQMNQVNDILHARGHIFLNEVYDLIGMPRTEAGQIVGWVDGMGDSFIDFNIIAGEDADGDNVIWMDFNVDGDIMYIFDKLFDGNGKDRQIMVYNG